MIAGPSRGCPTAFSGATLLGQAIDEDCLISAGIERADAVIATTYGDNSNLIAVQLARKRFNVERAIARVKDPVRASIFAKISASRRFPPPPSWATPSSRPWGGDPSRAQRRHRDNGS